MPTLLLYYLAIKAIFLIGLIRSFVKFDALQDYPTTLAGLYTAGVAFLSYMFQGVLWRVFDWREWEIWLAETFVLALIYFRLLRRFDEGLALVLLLILAAPLIWF